MKDFLKSPKSQRNILIFLIILILLLFYRNYNKNKTTEYINNQNIAAYTDSIRSYSTKNNKLIFETSAFITENNSLKKLNYDLYNELKEIKDNPIVIIKPEIIITEIPFEVPILPINNWNWNSDSSLYIRNFKWESNVIYPKGNFRNLAGNFDILIDTLFSVNTSKMRITTNEIGITLVTGLTENKKGLLEIFVKSDYPNFNITNLSGALIDPANSKVLKKIYRPKRWGFGIYGGYGIDYNITDRNINHGIQIGIGINYNIIQW